jgi:hypothetical protein
MITLYLMSYEMHERKSVRHERGGRVKLIEQCVSLCGLACRITERTIQYTHAYCDSSASTSLLPSSWSSRHHSPIFSSSATSAPISGMFFYTDQRNVSHVVVSSMYTAIAPTLTPTPVWLPMLMHIFHMSRALTTRYSQPSGPFPLNDNGSLQTFVSQNKDITPGHTSP